jgi:hypothetical protein
VVAEAVGGQELLDVELVPRRLSVELVELVAEDAPLDFAASRGGSRES